MIIFNNSKSYCLTNGQMFREGEGTELFIVKQILENEVEYIIRGQQIRLKTGDRINIEPDGTVVRAGKNVQKNEEEMDELVE